MRREFSFKDGVAEIIRKIEISKNDFVLVAVYGWPHSGKSYLIKTISRYYNGGKSVAGYEGSPNKRLFEQIRDSERMFICDLSLFHCAWTNDTSCFEDEDPGFLAREILGRELDFNIGIYNSNYYRPIEGTYDIIIRNSEAKSPEF